MEKILEELKDYEETIQKRGAEKEKQLIAKKLKDTNMFSCEFISEVTDMDVSQVRGIKK